MLPRAILFDLDDTLISAYGQPEQVWHDIAHEFSDVLDPLPPALVAQAVAASSEAFWSDPERHRSGRLQLTDARGGIVADAFSALVRAGYEAPDPSLTQVLARRYGTYREEKMFLFDGAHDVVDWFRARGAISSGAVEGLNNNAKVVMRKAYGFRTFRGVEVALYHTLGDLPEPKFTHEFC